MWDEGWGKKIIKKGYNWDVRLGRREGRGERGGRNKGG